MFPIFDHIDTLIAADFYEESNQNILSEAMRQLNRPNLEYWWRGGKWRLKNREGIYVRRSKSSCKTVNILTSSSRSRKSIISFSRSKSSINYYLCASVTKTKSTYRYRSK